MREKASKAGTHNPTREDKETTPQTGDTVNLFRGPKKQRTKENHTHHLRFGKRRVKMRVFPFTSADFLEMYYSDHVYIYIISINIIYTYYIHCKYVIDIYYMNIYKTI